jgi:tetratricopeptide (TPR) repeat protein
MKKIATLTFALAVAACSKNETPNPTPKESTPPPAAVASAAPASPKEEPVTTANKEALAAFLAGRDLFENVRAEEANGEFKKAVALDPKFASAIAMVGITTPGDEGDKMIASAIAQGSALPEAEVLSMRIAQASHARDTAKAAELGKRLAELVPMAWHAHYVHGGTLFALGNWDGAKVAYKKAIELGPTAAPPLNDLGCLELYLGDADDSVAHLKKYVELRPKEPNPHDSLGEALLLAGKYDDAEASFKKAIELDTKFAMAWGGLGFVHLYRGDYAKAYEAFGKYRDSASMLIGEKSAAYLAITWAQVAQGKPADALKTLDGWDADAAKAKDADVGIRATLTRGSILTESGKPAEAVKVLATLGATIDKTEAPETKKARWRIEQHTAETVANARLSKAAEADKARAAVEELVGKSEDAELKASLALARGEASLAKGDAKAASEQLKECQVFDDYCTWERMKAEEKAGLKLATREGLKKNHRRAADAFFISSKLAAAK